MLLHVLHAAAHVLHEPCVHGTSVAEPPFRVYCRMPSGKTTSCADAAHMCSTFRACWHALNLYCAYRQLCLFASHPNSEHIAALVFSSC